MQIGPYNIEGGVVLAPMAGVTDAPFRRICLRRGASLAVGEMASSKEGLRTTDMTMRRLACDAQDQLPVVQLLGADPLEMASAAQTAVACGAKIIDINFGCPARVVCGKACGSAIMREPQLAQSIMRSVADAVSGPVTVKMRTGWDEHSKKAPLLARKAQDAGLSAVTVHGRTRAQRFSGTVSLSDIAAVVHAVTIPVIANGDIDGPQAALRALRASGAAAVMVGRAARGNPWIFQRIRAVCSGRPDPGEPSLDERRLTVFEHLEEHLKYWMSEGCQERYAVRSFRMHLRPYLKEAACADASGAAGRLLDVIVRTDEAECLRENLETFFSSLRETN